MKLKKAAVHFIVEFIYNGRVDIPGELLTPVCEAAHALGVQGLTDFLPAPAKTTPSNVQESGTQSEAQTTTPSTNDVPTPAATTSTEQTVLPSSGLGVASSNI